jgi:hypothetical protein
MIIFITNYLLIIFLRVISFTPNLNIFLTIIIVLSFYTFLTFENNNILILLINNKIKKS